MKRWIALGLGAVCVLALAGGAAAGPKKLRTFGTGEASPTSARSGTITNDAGEYAGFYVRGYRSQTGKRLSRVVFSFVSTGDVAGGAPRFSIPIDEDGDGAWESYAFLDAFNCGASGSDDVVTVSTRADDCAVFYGAGVHANWDAFAAAHPSYRIADAIPFIISDQPGTYVVSDIWMKVRGR